MEKRRSYTQLRLEDRVVIASLTQLGASVRAMARALKRSPSTLSRELARNRSPADAAYASQAAHARHTARRVAARPPRKLDQDSVSWGVVRTLLDWKGSPQQIAATLKRVYLNPPAQHVSHETIYTAIYAQPRGELRRQLIVCLRHGRRPRTGGTDRRGRIPAMVSIHVRPPTVDDRIMPGHWEGDLIKRAPVMPAPWACGWSAPVTWCCWPGWTTQAPPGRLRPSPPNHCRSSHPCDRP